MKKNIFLCLAASLLLAGTLFAAGWGRLTPSPLPVIDEAGKPVNSRQYIVDAVVDQGSIFLNMVLDTPQHAFVLVFGNNDITAARLQFRKAGRGYVNDATPLKPTPVSFKAVRFNLDHLSPGMHRLQFSGLPGQQSSIVVVQQPQSPLELTFRLQPLAARSGKSILLTASFKDAKPLKEVDIQAIIPAFGNLKLQDNGKDGDEKAGDGIYSARYIAPEVAGMDRLTINALANGKRANGDAFIRTASAGILVFEQNLDINRDRIQTQNDGSILFPFTNRKGKYRKFRIDIIYGKNGTGYCWSQDDLETGLRFFSMTIQRPEEALAADAAVVRILNMETMGLEDEFRITLPVLSDKAPDLTTVWNKPDEPLPESKRQAAIIMERK